MERLMTSELYALGKFMHDFQSYIAKRRADTGHRRTQVQNYAYINDIDLQRQLNELDIAHHAVSVGLQAWRLMEGRKLKSHARELGRENERISKIWAEVCVEFNHSILPIKLLMSQRSFFEPYDGQSGTFFGLSGSGCTLPASTLRFLFGCGIGALDNGHVPYLTLLRAFNGLTRGILERVSQIPEALLHWQRSAEITEDRAGILAARDISAAIFAMMKSSLDWDDTEIMKEIRRYHEHLDVDWGSSEIQKRVKAIEIFMTSNLYRANGRPIQEIDAEVRKLYTIF